ncbi:MAG: hypothetical protein H0T60_17165 [Acidobacteria bacterium]|nr:hypothetical protein [Acidobacteriota bacterium]
MAQARQKYQWSSLSVLIILPKLVGNESARCSTNDVDVEIIAERTLALKFMTFFSSQPVEICTNGESMPNGAT